MRTWVTGYGAFVEHFWPALLKGGALKEVFSEPERTAFIGYLRNTILDRLDAEHSLQFSGMAAGKLTVMDATHVQPESRKPLVELAREFHCLPVARVLNIPEKICHDRNQNLSDRDFGPHVVRQQVQQLRRPLRGLEREAPQLNPKHVLPRDPRELCSEARGALGNAGVVAFIRTHEIRPVVGAKAESGVSDYDFSKLPVAVHWRYEK